MQQCYAIQLVEVICRKYKALTPMYINSNLCLGDTYFVEKKIVVSF